MGVIVKSGAGAGVSINTAAFAFGGANLSGVLIDRPSLNTGLPLVYGANVWVPGIDLSKRARVIAGKVWWERVSLLSVGQLQGTSSGELSQVEAATFNCSCVKLAAATIRLGLPVQTALPMDGLWAMCDNCCDCTTTGSLDIRSEGFGVHVVLDTNGVLSEQTILQTLPSVVTIPATVTVRYVSILTKNNVTYPSLAVAYSLTQCQDSVKFFVNKGRKIRNWTGAGRYSDGVLSLEQGAPAIGDFILDLDTGGSTTITGIAPYTTAVPIGFTEGDEWATYTIGDSQWLPDVAIDIYQSSGYGTGLVDYISFVRARAFCQVDNHDWRGIVQDEVPIRWLQLQAPQAGLLLTRKDDRVGLYPERYDAPLVGLFTAANARDFKYQYQNWDEHFVNQLTIDYGSATNCGKQRLNVYNTATHPKISEYCEWYGIDDRAQAIRLAVNYFNSINEQDFTVEFTTFIAQFTLEAGDLIMVQSPEIETGSSFSGYVASTNGTNIQPSWQPVLLIGTSQNIGSTLTDSLIIFTSLISVGDVVVNTTTGTNGIITAVSLNSFSSTVSFSSGDGYSVLDLTWSATIQVFCLVGTSVLQLTSTPVWNPTTNAVEYTTSGTLPEVGAPIIVSEAIELFRIASIEPVSSGERQGKSEGYSVKGTRWKRTLGDSTGLSIV
jgi:hypothetical protein